MPIRTLSIGHVNLRLRSPLPLVAPEALPVPPGVTSPPNRYHGFEGQVARGPAAFDTIVRLTSVAHPFAPPEPAAIFLDNPGAWSMAREGAGFRFWLPPAPGGPPPLWDTWLDHSLASATVRCGPGLQTQRCDQPVLVNPLRYPLDQLLLMYALARRAGCIVHAAGAILDGRAYIFPGRSSAGKTTLARQLAAHGGFELLSDDRMVVRRIGGRLWAFGTPWAGEADIARNAGAPLGGLLFLQHADANRVASLSPRAAMERLLPVTSIPWYHAEVLPDLLDFVGAVARETPGRELAFRPDPTVADTIVAAVR